MKKILLSTAAIMGVAFVAAPAMAQVDVTVGGYTKNYMGWLSQDDDGGEIRNFDMLRDSELHFNAEGTADNGLTYGFHVEMEVDGGDGSDVQESYLYLSSNLGRVNLGTEDGAAYLLQVAAPSADSNIDGLRSYVQATNYSIMNGTLNTEYANGIDYANDFARADEKVTYLSPNWNGLQFGVSYTPDTQDDTSSKSFAIDEQEDTVGSVYEGALRYEGTFNNVGFALGGGYTMGDVERDVVAATNVEDFEEWNIGADFDIGAFGLGAVYTEQDGTANGNTDEDETWVVGADYTTGPFVFGASYLNQDANNEAIDTDRYAGGVVYTVTQGLTLRGSINFVDHEVGNSDFDATSVMGGVQFNF
jgi:outer membrane protein OmpU